MCVCVCVYVSLGVKGVCVCVCVCVPWSEGVCGVCVCAHLRSPQSGTGRDRLSGAIGLSPSVPSALRSPQCCVQILQGRFAGTQVPPCQWNGEKKNGVFEI